MLRRLVWVTLAVSMASTLQAQTTTNGLNLLSTFKSISVKAPTMALGANATAAVQVKCTNGMAMPSCTSGSGSYVNALTPLIDRASAAPYNNQARVSIVGLSASTSYDVKLQWIDSGGVTGTNPITGTVVTLNYTPTLANQNTCTASDDTSLSNCLSGSNATVHLNAGNYAAFTISNTQGGSGANAYREIDCDHAGGAHINGVGVAQNIQINASFVIVQFCHALTSDQSGIITGSGTHDLYIQNNTFDAVLNNATGTHCTGANPPDSYGWVGINIGASGPNVFVLNNTITGSANIAWPNCNQNPIYNSPGTGISYGGATTVVIEGNTVNGGFRDAISLDDDELSENVDQDNNILSGYKDDGNESKGANVNLRIWNNVIKADNGNTCIATNSNANPQVSIGPFYVFRNSCRATSTTNGAGVDVYKNGGAINCYYFHNSIDGITGTSFNWTGYTGGAGCTFKNNIIRSKGSAILTVSSFTFDYNLYDWTDTGCCTFVQGSPVDYASFAAWKTGSSQDSHSLNTNPNFTNSTSYTVTLQINNTSPAFDVGVVLANFNDSTSFWPFNGAAPDIGAFEVGVACTPAKVVFTAQPGNADLGSAVGTVTVKVEDSGGNPCGADTSTITIAKHSGQCVGMTLNGTTSAANVFSVTNINLTAAVGTCSLDATDGALTSATSNVFTISCISTHLVFTAQPGNADPGQTIGPISVSVENQNNLVCPNDTSVVSLTKHAGTCNGMSLNGTTSGAANAGVFTTFINITGGLGACSLDASDSPLTGTTSNTFTITCTASQLLFTSQPGNANVGASVGTVAVSIENAGGILCTGNTSTVTITKHAGTCVGMTLNGTATGSAVAGIFSTGNLNLTGATGNCSLDCTDGSLTGATSNTFVISAQQAAPSGAGMDRFHLRFR